MRLIILILAFFSYLPTVFTQDSNCNKVCDKGLIASSKGLNMGYKCRKSRCEGKYSKDVSNNSDIILIKGFTSENESWNPNLVDSLLIKWNSLIDEGGITIQASGLSLRYQMDTEQSLNLKKFYWPTNVLTTLRIKKNQIGLIGKAKIKIGNRFENIYIPLSIGKSTQKESNVNIYKILIKTTIGLNEVEYSLYPESENRSLENPVFVNRKLNGGHFAADRIFEIEFTVPKKEKFYKLIINVKDKNDEEKMPKSIIFYSSNN